MTTPALRVPSPPAHAATPTSSPAVVTTATGEAISTPAVVTTATGEAISTVTVASTATEEAISTAAIQTIWAELVASTLADAGVRTCVVSPGSRSTPLVAALARESRLELPVIIDERSAAFFALGVARATGEPAAIVCTSGSAAAHYLPAIVEASAAGVPLVAITADRPPELQQCGATQTIDQVKLYGDFVRGAFDLGAPTASAPALHAVRRKIVQAATLARGPHPGPVHVQVPLRKPLEPAAPRTPAELALARIASELRAEPVLARPPRLLPDGSLLDALAAAIAAEPRGIVIAGALAGQPASRDALATAVFELCARAGYPLLAETGSGLRHAARPADVIGVDPFDIVLGAPDHARELAPRLIVQLGAEPVAAAWPSARAAFPDAERWMICEHAWHDPESAARAVVIGDPALAISGVLDRLAGSELRNENSFRNSQRAEFQSERSFRNSPTPEFQSERSFRNSRAELTPYARGWRDAAARASAAIEQALSSHGDSEAAVLRAAIDAAPIDAIVQIGNSLPIRVADHVCRGGVPRTVITQRGAAGIDGLIASAAGATRAGRPVLLVLGDVSFAHDVGSLLAARQASAPLAILVLDNDGGRIFDGLPIARSGLGETFERCFVTAPHLDPAAVAGAFGARGVTIEGSEGVGDAIAAALRAPQITVIHARCSASGARDVRRLALELAEPGGSHA